MYNEIPEWGLKKYNLAMYLLLVTTTYCVKGHEGKLPENIG